jgi:tRNA(Arg) A34 adenosine deaminase TadA
MPLPQLPRFFRASLRAIEDAGRDPELTAWVGAAIVRGGALIGTGANRRGMHAYVRRFWRQHRAWCASVHAEIDAVVRARRRHDLRGCRMYVARITRAGDTAMARPCGMCMDALGRHGFTEVLYTVDGGRWASEAVPPLQVRTTRWRRSQLRSRVGRAGRRRSMAATTSLRC